MKIEIKYIYVNRAIFIIILSLLAIGALIPYLIHEYIMHESGPLFFELTVFLNQNQFYFYLCVAIAFFLSLALAIIGLISKIMKRQTYNALTYGILGFFLSLFAFGSVVLTYFGLNLH